MNRTTPPVVEDLEPRLLFSAVPTPVAAPVVESKDVIVQPKSSGMPAIPGDANLDGVVDQVDYTIWYNHYGAAGAVWADGDFNSDGMVDQNDYTTWYNHYGNTSPIPVSKSLQEWYTDMSVYIKSLPANGSQTVCLQVQVDGFTKTAFRQKWEAASAAAQMAGRNEDTDPCCIIWKTLFERSSNQQVILTQAQIVAVKAN